MTDPKWDAADRYIETTVVPADDALAEALRASAAAGLPDIQVSPAQGRLLELLVAGTGAHRVLEVGTLGGYSAICMARGLPPGGRLVSLEAEPRHAEVARANVARAGLSDQVEIRVGRAIDSLPMLAAEHAAPFDLIFIDADKPSTAAYFDWAMKLARPGALIVVDNVVRQGSLADAQSTDANVVGMRRFLERVAAEPRARATVIQTVGRKGYDGFALVRVGAGP